MLCWAETARTTLFDSMCVLSDPTGSDAISPCKPRASTCVFLAGVCSLLISVARFQRKRPEKAKAGNIRSSGDGKMKRISTVLGTAVALTLLAGCAGGGTYGSYYGGGYSGTRSDSYGYRQP